MKAVILAGGRGTRLAEETELRPKPMIEIGGRPILWHIMKIYGHHGITDFVICLGYKGYLIKEYFANYVLHSSDVTVDLATNEIRYHNMAAEPWTVTLVDTGDDTQTGGRIARVAEHLDGEPFCLTYGDGVADIDVAASVAFHKESGARCTMTAVRPPGRFGAAEIDGGRVTRFAEKPRGDGGTINGGFFVCEASVLDLIDGDGVVWEQAPLNSMAEAGELAAWRHDGFWQPMDTLREKNQLEALWDAGDAPWKVWD
ncbi:MAG: glucose-1-phosphate cytidylyltransferase [Rhodospirillaceae bacterium]|jgi:glucose-1-phosphate cytidylyltransferase|nr:glucose-1-phosphate cytidylyltransferase [Rhodospirillaceae bacterium]MBT6404307.1 glucose-1-phosphate cytidylyltransferase [Rhodospirillaceae bacterium]MBT6537082.1 glucose-1-phosphate cytidylyltransferase [Rhodospirillaceae bacterium]